MTKQDRQNWTGVAILSVVLHALLFAYHAAAPANLALRSAGLAGEITICSGGSAKTVWSEAEDGGNAPSSPGIIIDCPVCSAAAALAMLPAPVGGVIAASESVQPFIASSSGPFAERPAYSHAARAPPLVA